MLGHLYFVHAQKEKRETTEYFEKNRETWQGANFVYFRLKLS